MDKNIFSDNFNRLISQKDIKIKDLGEKTGIRPEKLSKFRNPDDTVNPSIDDLIQLSDFFNITIDELLGHTKEENPQSIMLDFTTSLLKLKECNYFGIDIEDSKTGEPFHQEAKKFLSSPFHKKVFPQYNSTNNYTLGYNITIYAPSYNYQHMYHDIIHKTLSEYLELQNIPYHIKELWLKDRIKRLDLLYHFDEKPNENQSTENETKDSE